jgi:hypothetical protein
LDLAKDFLQTLIGPSVSELGQFFADKVKVWRLKNQINTLGKVQKILKEKNIKPQQVNLKVLLPYLDAVSLEEDETLQDIWANLLVNYVDSSKSLTSVVYPSILRQLSSNEIEVIEFMQKNHNSYPEKMDHATISDSYLYTLEDFSNLIRLGIIYNGNDDYNALTNRARFFKYLEGDIQYNRFVHRSLRLTIFGEQFIKACQRDD